MFFLKLVIGLSCLCSFSYGLTFPFPECFTECQQGAIEPCLISIYRDPGQSLERALELHRNTDETNPRVMVSTANFGLRELIISNLLNPELRGEFNSSTEFRGQSGFYSSDDQSYVITNNDLIFTINVSMPSSNYSFLSEEMISQGNSIMMENDIVFLADGGGGMSTFSFNGVNLTLLQSLDQTFSLPLQAVVIGTHADLSFVAALGSDVGVDSVVYILDRSNPADLRIISMVDVPHTAGDMDISRNFETLAIAGDRVSVVNIQNPFNPFLVATVDSPSDSDVVDIDFVLNDTRLIGVHDTLLTVWDTQLNFVSSINIADFTLPDFGVEDVDIQLTDSEFLSNGILITSAGEAGVMTVCPGNRITMEPQDSSDNRGVIAGAVVGSVLGCCCIVVLCGVILGGFVFVRREKHRKELSSSVQSQEEAPMTTVAHFARSKTITAMQNVTVGKLIARGNFGSVYIGDWRGVKVALKSLENANVEEFKREVEILKALDHPNVLRLYGLCTATIDSQDTAFMVTEYMEKRDLLNLLHQEFNLTVTHFEEMARQVARGMGYLHEKNIIHRDLACRNVLVSGEFPKFFLKIADFGLSRLVNDYYTSSTAVIPFRWAAPEAIEFHKFTKAADVYSFGVLVWEIYSRGAVPYSSVMTNSEVATSIKNGELLEIPQSMQKYISEIVLKCWEKKPEQRPTFLEIGDVMNKLEPRMYVTSNLNQNDPSHYSEEEAKIETSKSVYV